ncbi:hypothetical protein RU30_25610, partial [Salmonella enterica subsp. enterica serovar Give]|nr:hypothetical protein [Salmonella enterica subsp. enterica serovar Give]
ALGTAAKAAGDRSTALGAAAEATKADTAALGAAAKASGLKSTALGAESKATANGSVAIGSSSVANEENTVSFGSDSHTRKLVNVSQGIVAGDSTEAVNGAQLFAANGTVASALGTSVDKAGNIVAPVYKVDGREVNSVGDALTSIDDRTTKNTSSITTLAGDISSGKAGLVQLDEKGDAVFSDSLAADRAFNAGNRTVTGVKAARLAGDSTEAVNGAQLFATNQMVGKAVSDVKKSSVLKLSDDGKKIVVNDTAKKATTLSLNNRKIEGVASGKVSASSTEAINGAQLYKTNRAVVNNTNRIGVLEGQVGELSGKVNGMEKQIHHNRKIASAGIAGAMAMSSIPHVYTNDFSFGMAAAAYDDQGAISAGFNVKLNENAAARVNYSLDTQNKMGVGVGFAFGF